MTNTATESRDRLTKISRAFSDTPQLQGMFPSLSAFTDHMLRAEWESSDTLQAEFPNAASFAAWTKREASRA